MTIYVYQARSLFAAPTMKWGPWEYVLENRDGGTTSLGSKGGWDPVGAARVILPNLNNNEKRDYDLKTTERKVVLRPSFAFRDQDSEAVQYEPLTTDELGELVLEIERLKAEK